jgi:cytochrome c peroxidase
VADETLRLHEYSPGSDPERFAAHESSSSTTSGRSFRHRPVRAAARQDAESVASLGHSGPMLNTANEFTTIPTGAPPGWRAFDIGVSSRNVMNNPVRTFAVTDPCNNTLVVSSPDPGIMITDVYNIPMLAQFLPPKESCIQHPGFFANMFKTPQPRGVRHTAPYFHDNSVKDVEEVLQQYVFMFTSNSGFPLTDSNILLTQQDIKDIIAFLRLL